MKRDRVFLLRLLALRKSLVLPLARLLVRVLVPKPWLQRLVSDVLLPSLAYMMLECIPPGWAAVQREMDCPPNEMVRTLD